MPNQISYVTNTEKIILNRIKLLTEFPKLFVLKEINRKIY